MPCPYFQPAAKMEDWGRPARLPLGDAYTGSCRAPSLATWTPDLKSLREICNLGYGRGRCPRFPEQDPGPDAVRFSIAACRDGLVRIQYVQERDHLPFSAGVLEYSQPAAGFVSAPSDDLLQRQAQAYIECFSRRTVARKS